MNTKRYQKEALSYVRIWMDMKYDYPLLVTIKGRLSEVRETDSGYPFKCRNFFTHVPCNIEKTLLNKFVDPRELYEKMIKAAIEREKITVSGFTMKDVFQVESMRIGKEAEIQICFSPDSESVDDLIDRAVSLMDILKY